MLKPRWPEGRRHSILVRILIMAIGLAAIMAWLAIQRQGNIDCTGVQLSPGDNVVAEVATRPGGTTFCFANGTYRMMDRISPKAGDTFIAKGAVLSGAKLLSTWSRSGGSWVSNGQTEQSPLAGKCREAGNPCAYNEDLFMDDSRLKRVLSLGALSQGDYYFDYANDRIYLADDPSGHKVEVAVAPSAFTSSESSITIKGFTVEKFANPAGGANAAVSATRGSGWTIADNLVRLNHGKGITGGYESRILDNTVVHNGQMGIGGSPNSGLIEGNEIAFNNDLGFITAWESGGLKIGGTKNIVIRNNYSHDNDGSGIWVDVASKDALIEGNRVIDNTHQGIFFEISYDSVIRNNVAQGNGFGRDIGGMYGSNIFVSSSGSSTGSNAGVEVYGNTVAGGANGIGIIQANRIGDKATFGPHRTQDVYVHDNDITLSAGAMTGGHDSTGTALYTSGNNRFENNTYHLASSTGTFFSWMNKPATKAQWVEYGNDNTGTFKIGN
jgi:parallel beta-helix repeat protein